MARSDGSVCGAVLQDDKTPARCAPVLAARIANGEPSRFGVSASTDSFGSFSIDGFEADEYLVKVHPVRFADAERSLLPEASLEFRETAVIGAVAGRAGERSEPLTIHLRHDPPSRSGEPR